MRKQPQSVAVNIEFDGKTYSARCTVNSGVVTVTSIHGSSATQIGGSRAESVGRTLLREILQGARLRGEL